MEYVIVGLTCLILGMLIGAVLDSKRNNPTIGTLKIDTSGEEKDVYRLEFDKVPLDDLPKYKKVFLKVVSTVSPK